MISIVCNQCELIGTMSVVPVSYRRLPQRQLTKEDNFFLVQYDDDDSLQVRGRGFVLTEEKVRK